MEAQSGEVGQGWGRGEDQWKGRHSWGLRTQKLGFGGPREKIEHRVSVERRSGDPQGAEYSGQQREVEGRSLEHWEGIEGALHHEASAECWGVQGPGVQYWGLWCEGGQKLVH
jgi:hypothetical protein